MTNSLTRSKIHDSFDLSKICKKRFLRFDFQKLEEDPSIYRRITKKLQKTNSLTRLESQRSTTIDYSSIYRRFAIDEFFARRSFRFRRKIEDPRFLLSIQDLKTIPSIRSFDLSQSQRNRLDTFDSVVPPPFAIPFTIESSQPDDDKANR